jgi:hypothetical protein
MSEPETGSASQPDPKELPVRKGPPVGETNLVLLYSLIALALAAAIGFALMIVFPFYHRHIP